MNEALDVEPIAAEAPAPAPLHNAPAEVSGAVSRSEGPGGIARLLLYGFGLILLKPLVDGVRFLVGWRRRGGVKLGEHELELRSEVAVMGLTLSRAVDRVPYGRVASVESAEVHRPEPAYLGLLFLLVGLVWGVLRIGEGIYGRSAGLIGLGAGIVFLAIACDLALFWAVRRFGGGLLRGYRLTVRASGGARFSIVSRNQGEVIELERALLDRIRLGTDR